MFYKLYNFIATMVLPPTYILIVFIFIFCYGLPTEDKRNQIRLIESFPEYKAFGQLSAVSVDKFGHVYVFHRGDRVWDQHSFNLDNRFVGENSPIGNNTILVLDPVKGSLIQATGSHMFYMPHGLTVDYEDNIWITDVGLHQVFKFSPLYLHSNHALVPLLTLGIHLEPGADDIHFCKPTDVVVDSTTGDFYVSDGYCNSRILKFNKTGSLLLKWGRASAPTYASTPYTLNVPHALTLDEMTRTIFVADRENSRIVAFNSDSGSFIAEYGTREQARVYSVAYSPNQGGTLFAVDAPGFPPSFQYPGTGVVYDITNTNLMALFAPPGHFQNPHDLAISPDGKYIYVVELNPYRVWQFKIGTITSGIKHSNSGLSTVKKQAVEMAEEAPVVAAAAASAGPNKLPDGDIGGLLTSGLGGTQLAGFVVSLAVLSILIFFLFHLYKRKGNYKRSEIKGLILEDYDDEEPF